MRFFKALWLVILLFPVGSFGSIDANTVFLTFKDGTGTDFSANGNNLILVGTVGTSTINGVLYTGPFTASNYYDTNAALKTLLAGLTTWTIEWDMVPTDISNSPSILGTTGFNTFFQVHSTNGVRCALNGTTSTFVNPITAGIKTLLAFTYDSTKLRVYVNNSVVQTTTQSGAWGTNANMFFGRDVTAGLQFNGFLSYLRISNIARTSFPTVDQANNPLSPYLDHGKSFSPSLMPPGTFGALLERLFFTTPLYALEADSRVEQKYNQVTLIKEVTQAATTKLNSDITKGLVSFTPTRTLDIRTPTTTPTYTITSTISPTPTITQTFTITQTPTISATASKSQTITLTPTISATPTLTETPAKVADKTPVVK